MSLWFKSSDVNSFNPDTASILPIRFSASSIYYFIEKKDTKVVIPM